MLSKIDFIRISLETNLFFWENYERTSNFYGGGFFYQ